MSSLRTDLEKASKVFQKGHLTLLVDIVLFGSFVRGKAHPNDLDILLIFTSKVDKEVEYAFRKMLQNRFPAFEISIISKTQATWKEDSFSARDSIFFEGVSLLRNCTLASEYGQTSFGLFLYNIKDFTNTQRTRFYYALNGRESSGMIKEFEGMRFSHNQILVPVRTIELAKEFFTHWKVEFDIVPLLLPSRLAFVPILQKLSNQN